MSDVMYGAAVGLLIGGAVVLWGVMAMVGYTNLMRWFDRRYKP